MAQQHRSPARPHQRQPLLQAAHRGPGRDRPPAGGDDRGLGQPPVLRGRPRHADQRAVRQLLGVDAVPAGVRVAVGDGERQRPGREDRAHHQRVVPDRRQHHRRVDLPPVHRAERVGERDLRDLRRALRVGVPEGRDRPQERVVRRPLEADAEHAPEAARRVPHLADRRDDRVEGGPQPRVQLLAERGEPHPAARPVDQPPADPALQRPQQLTDPALREVEALPGPAEVQFLGQGEERLQLPDLRIAHVFPRRPSRAGCRHPGVVCPAATRVSLVRVSPGARSPEPGARSPEPEPRARAPIHEPRSMSPAHGRMSVRPLFPAPGLAWLGA